MSLLHWESSMDFHHADSESLVSTYSRDFLDIMWSIFSWLTSGLISTPFPPDADHRESLLFLLIHVKNSSVLHLHGGAPHFIKSQVSSPPSRDPPQSHPPLTAFLLNSVSSSKHLWLIESIAWSQRNGLQGSGYSGTAWFVAEFASCLVRESDSSSLQQLRTLFYKWDHMLPRLGACLNIL